MDAKVTHNASSRQMKVAALKQVQYDPRIFLDVENVDEAVKVILTPEDGLSSVQRWKNETPYLMGLIERFANPPHMVLDYGCGIGRLAKPLIEKHHARVVGVDLSPNMLALACSCVASDKFAALSPSMLWHMQVQCDFALAVWTLQHVSDLDAALDDIGRCVVPDGIFFVVNNRQRVVPSTDGWLDDGRDVHEAILDGGFALIERGELQGADIAPGVLCDNTFWAAYRKV